MADKLVELKTINKMFSGVSVLKNVDLSVYAGEVLCLVGENGSGKSTLIKIISGVYPYEGGELYLAGKHFAKPTPTQSINEGIQVIYQDFSVFSNLTVAENIAMSSNIQNKKKIVNWRRNHKIASEALKKIDVKMDLEAELASLSVAQKQIVAISRAISQKAKLIIMDEPTTALTRKEIDRLFEIIRGLKAQGIAIIFVSHKLDEVFEICDRIAVIRSGEIVVDLPVEEFPRDKLVYYMIGKDIQEECFACSPSAENPMIRVNNISRRGEFRNVSFSVRPGEILAITGQLGSGRTELALSLFGINPIQSGEIFIQGKKVKIKNQREARKLGIAYLPEDRLSEGLYMNRSLGDNFSSVIISQLKNRFGIIKNAVLESNSNYWIEKLGMTRKRYTTPASDFSGGNQQRIVLGKWLATSPKIFVLNGPTVGVDVKSKSEIHAVIKDLAAQGMAVIIISDDIGEILSTSSKVIVMRDHHIIFEGNTCDISHQELNAQILSSQAN
ncbi:MAG: sugar ABC transporter ATP-binding protein [Eubacteriales bacterium]|nr:sugar ABC transporter ATP-binding protein [Eubacteriales bacterium]